MDRTLDARLVAKTLKELGFDEIIRGGGSHHVFVHRATNLRVTAPGAGKVIRPVHVAAIKAQLANFDIATEQDFEARLRRASAEAA